MTYQYDAGEQRHKHHWNKSYAGVIDTPNGPVGKCPNTITQELAEKLLNEDTGIPWYNPKKRKSLDPQTPNAIYNVHEGVVYKAVPTRPGCSYHGYPVKEIPKEIQERLYQLAEQKHCKRELEKWLKDK
jgi:hypothetical protein